MGGEGYPVALAVLEEVGPGTEGVREGLVDGVADEDVGGGDAAC